MMFYFPLSPLVPQYPTLHQLVLLCFLFPGVTTLPRLNVPTPERNTYLTLPYLILTLELAPPSGKRFTCVQISSHNEYLLPMNGFLVCETLYHHGYLPPQ